MAEARGFTANSIIKPGVKVIPNNSFTRNKIEVLHIPESVEEIGAEAFSMNKISILDVNWGKISCFGFGAFQSNNLSGTLDLLDFVGAIPNFAFIDNHLKSSKII